LIVDSVHPLVVYPTTNITRYTN